MIPVYTTPIASQKYKQALMDAPNAQDTVLFHLQVDAIGSRIFSYLAYYLIQSSIIRYPVPVGRAGRVISGVPATDDIRPRVYPCEYPLGNAKLNASFAALLKVS